MMPAVSQKCWRRVLSYRCRQCWLPFLCFGQLLSHVNRRSSGGLHNCVECQKVFHSLAIYQRHECIFHSNNRPVIGEVCSPGFVFHSGLKKCLKWQKWRGRNSEKRQTVVIRAQRLHLTETGKRIAATPETPKSNAWIAARRRSADSNAIDYATEIVSLSTNGLNKARTYSCPSCSETFLVLSQLRQHMRTHNDLRPYKCMHCEKQYKQNAHLTQHVRTVHEGERPYRCLQCSKAFARRSHLVAHSATHPGKKSFQCDICEIRFAHRFQLTAHQQV